MSTNRNIVVRAKLSYSDLADVKKLVSMLDDAPNHRIVAGVIHGMCNDTVMRSSPDGQTQFTGLSGRFEAVPDDPTRPVIQSSVCFLPDAFTAQVVNVLKGQLGETGKERVTGCQFAFEFSVYQAKNPRGYSWEASPLGDIAETDPFAHTRAMIEKRRTPQLVAPNLDPVTEPEGPVVEPTIPSRRHRGG